MNLITTLARRWLEARDYKLLEPDEIFPLPIYDDETAVRYVRTMGYDVTRPQPELRQDQCWRPSEGGSRPRWVRSVGDDLMSYAVAEHGLPITINRATWDRWVRRANAVCS